MFGWFARAASLALAIPVFITYVESGLVPRLPTAILSTGLMLTAFLAIACGFILDTVTRGRKEMKRLAYLASSRATSRASRKSRPRGLARPKRGVAAR